jgi:hypothetical protein
MVGLIAPVFADEHYRPFVGQVNLPDKQKSAVSQIHRILLTSLELLCVV